jgi:hypothetical protein
MDSTQIPGSIALPWVSTYRVVHAPSALFNHVDSDAVQAAVHRVCSMSSASYLPRPAHSSDGSQFCTWFKTATHVEERLVDAVVKLYN